MPFSIRCQACHTEFAISDDLYQRRVAGNVVNVKCRRCRADLTIDGRDRARGPRTTLTPPPADVAQLEPDALRRVKPRPTLESRPDDELWVVSTSDDADDLELFESLLIDEIVAGRIPRETIVWCERMPDWLPISEVPSLSKHFPHAAGAPSPEPSKGRDFMGEPSETGPSAGGVGRKPLPQPPRPIGRKSAPPPLDKTKRLAARRAQPGHASLDRPVALSPGLFDIDASVESEPPMSIDPEPVVDDEEEPPPSSGTPALRALTHHTSVKPGQRADAKFLLEFAPTDAPPLGPPTIDMSFTENAEQARKPSPPPRPARDVAVTSEAEQLLDADTFDPREAETAPRSRGLGSSVAGSVKDAAPKSSTSWRWPAAILFLAVVAGATLWLVSTRTPTPNSATLEETTLEQARAPSEPRHTVTAKTPGAAEEPEPDDSSSAAASAAPRPAAKDPVDSEQQVTNASTEGAEPAEGNDDDPDRQAASADGSSSSGTTDPGAASPTPPASGAPDSTSKPNPTSPESNAGPFDKNAAVAALNAAAGQAANCRRPGDPSGTARVVITFAPSGRVTSANINGPPFAGTATGGCIAATMRRAQVPAFGGDFVTVSKSVVIQ